MPRKSRIDEPGMIHHVFARGIERRQIFNDDDDAEAFLARLEKLVLDTGTQILAFALIPNHFHLLLRRTGTPVSTFMQRLLTSYAIYFNKRHGRSGHLFQNRYKAIPCHSDQHFLELVRYIHLNPLKAGLVGTLEELGKFPYSGHKYLLGGNARAWFNPNIVLVHFGSNGPESRKAYQDFVAAGMAAETSVYESGCHIDYPASSLDIQEERPKQMAYHAAARLTSATDVDGIISEVCLSHCITQCELLSSSRRRAVAQARALLAYRMSKEMGLAGSEIGRRLSVSRSAASKMISKGGKLEAAQN